MPNRLASEQSPYLLQHKDNPVEWYPWGDEAFERARREDRPIFLSIGYSTCHWCHVMEHESFEQTDVAHALNRDFVSIKVDREERPDVDRVYMAFVQATTGSGGWPMSVWLTPTLEPFYGGTYFPPTSRWGRPGFIEVLQQLARLWREERVKVLESAATVVARLRSMGPPGVGIGVAGVDTLDEAVRQFWGTFDPRRGGFGDAPKFPRPSELLFLLREHARTENVQTRDMVLVTLRAMALGGMRDHVGGGFHRYSVDGDWRVPHFEKMLYDQAQLVLAYLEAGQSTDDRFYLDVATDTLQYVRRDLRDDGGAFYSAEDADSVPPEDADNPSAQKSEGAFYIWRDAEIGDALGPDAAVFRLRYGVEPDGNAPFDPQSEFTHKNLLYTARPLEDVTSATGRSLPEVESALSRARQVLFDIRARRPRPHLDDKVLTAWNGLMIGAFARAARVVPIDGERYLADALGAATFIRERLWNPEKQVLYRRYRNGEVAIEGYAEDYAYLIFGLIELFQSTGDPQWIEWVLDLQRRQDTLFWDAVDGGWFSTTGTDASVLLRLKEDYDGAEPAATSVATLNLLALAHLTGDGELARRAEQALAFFGRRLTELSRGVPMMLAALSTYHAGMPQVVVVGPRDRVDTREMLAVARSIYLPSSLHVPVDPATQTVLAHLLPWIGVLTPRDGRATAYVCRDFTCEQPVTNPADLRGQLMALSRRG